jgi:hypothetical protein
MPINKNAVQVGVLVGIGNLIIFQHFMPPVTDVKAGEQFNPLAESSERTALLVSVGFSALAAGFVKSWDTFLIAGAVIVGIDFAYKHAIACHPNTGNMQSPMQEGAAVHSLPDYADVAQ